MKRRFIMITIILAMVSITWLFGKNRALTQLLDEGQTQDTNHIDRIFDLEQENADLMDYVMTLETENSILNSCCNNGGLDYDNTLLY